MMSEQSKMISVRLPKELVARVDFVARNAPGPVKNRSTAVLAALKEWLSGQEKGLADLGLLPKKARS